MIKLKKLLSDGAGFATYGQPNSSPYVSEPVIRRKDANANESFSDWDNVNDDFKNNYTKGYIEGKDNKKQGSKNDIDNNTTGRGYHEGYQDAINGKPARINVVPTKLAEKDMDEELISVVDKNTPQMSLPKTNNKEYKKNYIQGHIDGHRDLEYHKQSDIALNTTKHGYLDGYNDAMKGLDSKVPYKWPSIPVAADKQ